MPRKLRTLRLSLPALVVLAMMALVIVAAIRKPALPPLPNPNGYDDFLNAGTLLTGGAGILGNAANVDRANLQAFVSTNSEPLRLVRLGLTRQCSVPTDSAITNIDGMIADFANLKSLGQLLAAEGRLHEMDNRLADAAQSYLDAIHFGNEISRGGFIINRLVGMACERCGETPLSKLAPKLGSPEARRVIAELEKADSAEVTWDEVRRNERRFVQYRHGFITWIMDWQARQRVERKHKYAAAHLRLLIAEFGVRCYQSEQSRAPAVLEQLVPKYLQRVPLDPFNGQPLIYRPQGDTWLLYSVGEDGVDDGGKPASRSVPGGAWSGDVFYDSPY